jgi:Protein of unknown function (DUF2505)
VGQRNAPLVSLPVDFVIDQALAAPPSAVQDAQLDPDFVRRTASIPKIGDTELVELTRTDSTARLRVRYRFTAPLSGAVTRVIDPKKLTWIDDGTFHLANFTSEHVLLPDNYADRLTASYTSTLEPSGTGTTWTLRGALDVHAPLVGGRVAKVIVDGLREAVAAQAALLDEWIAERA